jgi:hypothetical protein
LTEQAEIPGIEAAGGGLVVPLDPAAIRLAIETTLANSVSMGDKARSHVLAQHSRESVVVRLSGYLSELMTGERS